MNLLKTTTVRSSILAFAGLALMGALVMGALAARQASTSAELSNALLNDVRITRAAGLVDMVHDGLLGAARGAILAGIDADAAAHKAIQEDVVELSNTMRKSLDVVAANAHDGAIAQAVANVKPVVERYLNSAKTIVDLALKDVAAAKALRPGFDADFRVLEDQLEKLSGFIESRAETAVAERDALYRRQAVALVGTLLATMVALSAFGLLFSRTLMLRLGAEPAQLKKFAGRIANGELHVELDAPAAKPGSLAASMVAMRDQLRDAVAAIREGADSVATGSSQIASGNQDLASRTELQAGSLQQTAASMEQMTGSVQQTSEHAKAASKLVTSASAVALRGGEAVHRVVATMGEIHASSRKIADITSVIDGIAFQTNILALNAAVEAARAGEQGRGFAVVASEVRSLAQRSAAAAREIKLLIESSAKTVDTGSQLVTDAGGTMQEIVSQVKQVHELIHEITVATGEQTAGIGGMNRSVAELDGSTQQNAGLVEESAAAARMLSEQASRLLQVVSRFKLTAT